jgi:hypothetical protein
MISAILTVVLMLPLLYLPIKDFQLISGVPDVQKNDICGIAVCNRMYSSLQYATGYRSHCNLQQNI